MGRDPGCLELSSTTYLAYLTSVNLLLSCTRIQRRELSPILTKESLTEDEISTLRAFALNDARL